MNTMKLQLLVLATIALSMTLSAQNNLDKGDMYRDMRDYSKAIEIYEEVYQSEPSNQEVCVEIARAYVQMQDYLNASKWYEKVVDETDVTPEWWLEYGDVLKSLRLNAKAKFYYQKYAGTNPEVAQHFVSSCDNSRLEADRAPMYQIKPAPFNSPGMEFGPSIVGDELMFNAFGMSAVTTEARQTSDGVSLNQKNSLNKTATDATDRSSVRQFDPGLKNEGMVTNVRISENGKWVAFNQSDFRSGQRLFDARAGKMSLFVGKVNSDGSWSEVVPFPHNGNGYSTGYPAFSPDGTVMYFASTRPGGYGGWDIYVSFRSNDGWTAPQNLGPVVNTPGNEISPFHGSKRLYFSSDWHQGLGGFDIFMATSNEGQWVNVYPAGAPLNSAKDDLDVIFSSNGQWGYITSNRVGSSGQYDIYRFEILYDEFKLTVMDQEGKTGIQGARITSPDNSFAAVTTDGSGNAVIRTVGMAEAKVVITHPDYRELAMAVNTSMAPNGRYEVFVDRSLEDSGVSQDAPVVASSNDATSNNAATSTAGTTSSSSAMAASSGGTIPSAMQPRNNSAEPEPEVVVTTKTIVVGDPEKTSGTVSEAQESEPVVDNPPVAERPSTPVGQFAVQVAALGKQSSMSKYEILERYGKVMQYPENGMYKIRVGYYRSEADAKNALSGIRKSGYPDAFIVRANPASAVVTDTEPTAPASTPQVVEESKPSMNYMVRLGTYSKPEYFQADKVEHLGRVDSRKSGQYTIMLLTGFDSPEAAEKAREGAVAAGFKDAHIAIEENGTLKRYRG